MRKKLVSLLLTFCLFMTMFSVTPFAMPIYVQATMHTNTVEPIKLGEYVELGRYNDEDILWRCVAFEKAMRQADGSILIDSTETSTAYSAVGENEGDTGYLPLMVSDKIITIKAFDAAGSNTSGSHSRNSDGYRNDYGSHYWGDSNLRTWLNGTYAAGGASWPCGNAPTAANCWNGYNPYDQEAGFLNSANFNTQALKAITEVTQRTQLSKFDQSVATESDATKQMGSETYVTTVNPAGGSNTWSTQYYSQYYYELNKDKMFCLDVRKLDNLHTNSMSKGWKAASNANYYYGTPTAGAVEQSRTGGCTDSSLGAGKNWHYWLRSPYYNNSIYMRYVSSDGRVDGDGAYRGGIGVRPAFFLDAESVSFVCGNGTSDTPYTLDSSHTLIHHEKVSATLTTDGTIEYWECGVCGKKFSDEAATNEITDTAIPAGIQLGDYVELGTYNGEDILWRCVAFEKATRQADGSILIDSTQTSQTYQAVGPNAGDAGYLPLMVSDKIITIKAFDANGTTQGSHSRDSSNRNSYGSNYWGDSNLRDWLNSEAASVTWTDGNAPTKAKCYNYNGYDQEAGFLSPGNFSDQAKKAIARNVKQKSLLHSADESEKDSVSGTAVHTYNQNIGSVAQNYASAMYKYETDSVFCLDVQQLSNMYNNTKNDTNASGSAYYIGTPTAGAVEQSDYTDSSLATGTNWYYWLRAPYYRFSLYVRSVGSGGQVDGNRAYYGDGGVRPAFFLNPAAANFDFGSGTSDAPYRFYKGEGTAESPYEIPDLETLEAFRDKVNGGETYEGKHFKLPADIDMSGTYSASTGTSWTPIGNSTNKFKGSFDGGGHRISGLYINSSSDYQGLFGYLDTGGEIKNLGVDGTVSGGNFVGGVCGSNYGTIQNCYNTGAVSGATAVGGVCGSNCGTIQNCYNTGSVSGESIVGGVCGGNSMKTIKNCYNTGAVSSGGSNVGGVCGRNELGTIKNCYYLTGTSAGGISGTDVTEQAEVKTTEDFALGEVARLLQGDSTEQIWGQALSGSVDASPVLMPFLTDAEKAARTVYKVLFKTSTNENYAVRYANSGGTVILPDEPEITDTNYAFAKWATSQDADAFTAETQITGDITLNAYKQEKYGEENGEHKIETTYGTAKTLDLSTCVDYGGATTEAGKFDYSIQSGNDTLGASISDDTLTVPATAPAGSYTLNIQAIEKEPQVSLLSTRAVSRGTEPVSLTVKVTISSKSISGVTIDPIADQIYTGSPIRPPVSVQDGAEMLEPEVDYTVSYDSNTNVGRATVRVIGTGNYTGTATANFTIGKADQASPSVTINYAEETLATTTEMEWSADGASWMACAEDMAAADLGWNGTADKAVKFRMAGDSNHNDSEAQSVTIPARPTVPYIAMKLTKTKDSVTVTNTGDYSGCEFSIGSGWKDLPEFTGLTAGQDYTVQFRVKATGSSFHSEALKQKATTVAADGSTTLKVGETAEIGDSVITNDGETVTVENGGTTTIITPPFGGAVEIGPSGAVTVPNDGTVQTDDGPVITLPQGGNVMPNGSVTVPEGGKVTIEDDQGTKTTITPPSGGEVTPSEDGGVHVDKGTTVQTGNGPVITLPDSGDGGTVLPGGTVSGSPIQVGDTTIEITATDPTQGDITTDKDGNVILPGGTTANVDRDGDGTPDATVTIPGDGVSPADPGVVKPNGEMELPGGGSVTISDGSGTTTITVPENGGTVAPGENGAVTVPGGSTVTIGGETVTIPESGGTVKPGGEVIYTVTVTFDAQGGSDVPSQTVMIGDQVTEPTAPTQNGCTFGGWYKESDCQTDWNFDDPVTGSMTLYAKWTKKPTPITPDPDDPGIPDEPPVWENPFIDVTESAWYYMAVKFANENGLFYGTSDTTFSPNDDMSRGMLATVLYRLAKELGTTAEDLFSDVADDKYYAEAVAWAAENNIVTGYGNNRFGPEDPITREQLATILWRYAGSPASTGNLDKFTDGAKTSDWAIPALQWAVEQKIVSGKGNGILDPRGKATRAEVATMLMRYCGMEQ